MKQKRDFVIERRKRRRSPAPWPGEVKDRNVFLPAAKSSAGGTAPEAGSTQPRTADRPVLHLPGASRVPGSKVR